MKRAVPVLGLAAVLAAAPLAVPHLAAADEPAAATGAGGASPAKATISWGKCPEDADVHRATFCGTVKVPLDYANPGGRQITRTVSREAASGTRGQRKGVLLVNPGGPGESGLGLAHQVWAKLPQDLGEAYDVIGFDPRGVGHSAPVDCGNLERLFPHPLPDYVPAGPADTEPHLHRARAIAKQCGEAAGDLLPYITTDNAARDIDRIRVALGEEKINYLGYSYGTQLGAVYATLFPQRVNRMILDSVVEPNETGYKIGFDQTAAYQKRINQFFDWVARHDRTYRLGTTRAQVAQKWAALRKRLAREPAGKAVGPSELDDIAAGAMYVDVQWSGLAGAVAEASRGNDAELAGIGESLTLDAPADGPMLAYNCADSPWPRDWARWDADTRRAHETAPAIAWLNTWYSAPCAYWPVPGKVATPIQGKGLPPVLLLQAKFDAATPLAGARKMRAALPSSRLVVEGGGNHAQYLYNENACIDRIGSGYLRTGKVPANDTTCPATPQPEPEGAGAASAADALEQRPGTGR